MTRRSEDDYFSIDRLNKQLEDSIEQSKEMTKRSQALLDRQRVGALDAPHETKNGGGEAA